MAKASKRVRAEQMRINGLAHQIADLTKKGPGRLTLTDVEWLVEASALLAQVVIENELVVADEGSTK